MQQNGVSPNQATGEAADMATEDILVIPWARIMLAEALTN